MWPRRRAITPLSTRPCNAAVGRRPGRAGQGREIFLGERQAGGRTVAEGARQAAELGDHPLVRRHGVRVEQRLGQAAHLGGEDPHQHVRHRRMLALEVDEHLALQRAGLDRPDGDGRRRAPGVRVDQALLAEHLPRRQHVQRDRRAARIEQPDRDVALLDEVQAVGGIALMEERVAVTEPTAGREREHPPPFGLVEPGQDVPVHAPDSAP